MIQAQNKYKQEKSKCHTISDNDVVVGLKVSLPSSIFIFGNMVIHLIVMQSCQEAKKSPKHIYTLLIENDIHVNLDLQFSVATRNWGTE